MSKNPSIKEGGQAKQFTDADKIQTKLVGGGTQNWVPENEAGKYADVGTLYANKNGTYYSKSDKKDGYNKVVVKVAGSNGSARQDGKPSTLDGGDIAPGGSGSAVVGEDEDGNDAVVGVDKDGNLVKTPIPSSIKIITPPTKTEYTAGEAMDYSGIVVGLKKKDSSTFTDSRYLNGHIPMGELVFPVEVAPEGGGSGGWTADSENIISDANSYLGVADGHEFTKLNGGNAIGVFQAGAWDRWYGAVLIARDKAAISTNWDNASSSCVEFKYDGATWYMNRAGHMNGATAWDTPLKVITGAYSTEAELGVAILKAVNARAIGDNIGTIPVQWVSPYTKETMKDSFEITIARDSSTTESSSGTEGSGGGGSF